MSTYADRFTEALARRLPEHVDVENSQGMIVIARGTARVVVRPGLVTDRRGSVHDDAVTAALTAAARKLRGEVPKYREEFRALSLELAGILEESALVKISSFPDGLLMVETRPTPGARTCARYATVGPGTPVDDAPTWRYGVTSGGGDANYPTERAAISAAIEALRS